MDKQSSAAPTPIPSFTSRLFMGANTQKNNLNRNTDL